MKKVAILGSTGSIGNNALKVIRQYPDQFQVSALAANTSKELLEKQALEFKPSLLVLRDKSQAEILQGRTQTRVLSGDQGLMELAKNADYDILISSLVGFAGLAPTIEGIKRGKRIALANKETLVAAGSLVMKLAQEYSSEIIPVDSEHSAIFQVLKGETPSEVRKLLITASGGPFLNRSAEELGSVRVEDALNHPRWKMGRKVTIDSSTMMNKGLEVIEARWLFKMPPEKIEILIQPESVIHSLVEFVDGSIKAQMSFPDMKIPIQYALTYPERLESSLVKTDFPQIGTISFFAPDFNKFACLGLAFDALREGGEATCILNAANEIAVEAFLKGRIGFTEIPRLISYALENIENRGSYSIESIFDCDNRTRKYVQNLLKREKV